MTGRLVRACALAVMLAGCSIAGLQADQLSGAQADIATINKLLADLMGAYQAKNVAGMTALMATDVKGFGESYTANGVEEVRVRVAASVAGIRGTRLVGGQDVVMSGNIAYVPFMLTVDREGGMTSQQRWTVVFERRSSRWQITHFHISPGR